jgi:hypothetical protein
LKNSRFFETNKERFTMKKILALLLVMIGFAVSLATEPAANAYFGSDWELITASTAVVRVTGTTAGAMFTKQSVQPGWEYVLVTVDSIGGTTDSGYVTILGYGSNSTTQTASQVIHVARTGTTYSVNSIPVGTTLFPRSISATFTRYNATNKSKIDRWELYRRRPMNAIINWNTYR